jgi:pectinesterase
MKFIQTFAPVILCLLLFFSSARAGEKYDIIVAADGSGDFASVQEAVNSCRAYRTEDKIIFIKNGIYREKVLIHSYLSNIHLIGESRDSTILSYDDHVGRGEIGTFNSYTVKVAGNNIVIENITIENASGRTGQAVALHVEGDCNTVINCRVIGNQDTLYATGWRSRQYYCKCYIEGTIDYIFGSATAIFRDCTIHSKDDSYITAASTPGESEYGFVFINCHLTSDPEIQRVFLGRPWGDYAKAVFIGCAMEHHIAPEGWHNWSQPDREKTSYYAEYGCTGPGASLKERVNWSHQLKAKDVKKYTTDRIFIRKDKWNPLD